jgi:hypothetical protein
MLGVMRIASLKPNLLSIGYLSVLIFSPPRRSIQPILLQCQLLILFY